jgi:uncharacterized membrane-anchored protein
MKTILLSAWVALLLSWGASAQAEPTAEQKAEMQRMLALLNSLKPINGVVKLPAAKATLNLGDHYYFLAADDARRVLTEGWGNPAGASEDVLGLIFPKGKTFLDDSWGAVVRYQNTFYVSDADARTANYDSVLKDLKAAADQENVERKKEGYPPLSLVGWAQQPTYAAQHHDLIWAREVAFADEQDHTLNYDVRHLGRAGVLSVNVISDMAHLGEIRGAAAELASTAEFEPGSRYQDYKTGDKKARYGLAGLVAAGIGLGVAKQAGLLAGLVLLPKKGAVIIVAALAGAGNWLRRRFRKKDA